MEGWEEIGRYVGMTSTRDRARVICMVAQWFSQYATSGYYLYHAPLIKNCYLFSFIIFQIGVNCTVAAQRYSDIVFNNYVKVI